MSYAGRQAARDRLVSLQLLNPAHQAIVAGIGGLRRGFESIGGQCVFTSEWNKYSQLTYKANFPNDTHLINSDITAVEADAIPKHEVLIAGFPGSISRTTPKSTGSRVTASASAS